MDENIKGRFVEPSSESNETVQFDNFEKSNKAPSCFIDDVPENLFNQFLDEQNPSSFCPPRTDNGGSQSPFKYPFSFASRTLFSAGWVRQVTVRELPISTRMAGVQMRLLKGAIREMHWHTSSEWAIMLYGQVRITVVDQHGRSFVDDVQAGDLWLFPTGLPHSIQGTGDDGGFFLLVFPDGNFNDFGTDLLTEWMRHIPRDVLAKNFQVSQSTFSNLPQQQLYIFEGQLPQSLETERMLASQVTGTVPQSFSFYTNRMRPNITRAGGHVKIIDANNFPVTDIAAAIVTLRPGAMRELHWHPNADEWLYYIKGKARMGVFVAGGEARTMDFQAGDVGYVPQNYPHFIENTCGEDVIYLEAFPTSTYQGVSLAEWLAHTPPVLVNQHIRTGEQFINRINRTEAVIVP